MDLNLAGDEEQTALKRIVALLLALANLAELAATRPLAVRVPVLWLLLAAEAVARNLVTRVPAPCPFHHGRLSRADAVRLVRRLRNLACVLDRRTALAVRDVGIGEGERSWASPRRWLHRAYVLFLFGQFAGPASWRALHPPPCGEGR